MKNLITFYLKRRFFSRLTLILGLVLFRACGFITHADRLSETETKQTVYLDESCSFLAEQLISRSNIYRDTKNDTDNNCVLCYEDGWILTGKQITEELIRQVENDVRAVESEIYLRKADLVEKEFIERYKKSFTVSVKNNKKTDVSTLVVSAVFYLILTYSNLISNEIIYEKSTHMLDMIICCAGERAHFFGKIITAYLSLLIQGTWIVSCRFFWLVIRFSEDHFRGLLELAEGYVDTQNISLNSENILLLGLLLIVSLLFIQIVMMMVTCMFRDSEEAATFQNVYYVILIVLYYLFVIRGGPIEGNTAIELILSYVPLVTMIFMPVRVLTGQAGSLDVIMSIVITTGVLAVIVELILPQYKKLLLRK